MLTSGYWQSLATTDFASVDAERTIAVLPVAAVEQHGPHLPLSTDAIINDGIINATLERLPRSSAVLVLPAQSVGTSAEHADFPGTLSIDAETLLRVWLEIGASVARAGVRKLVIFNTHGGQRALVDLAALRLRVDHDLFVVRANYFSFGAPEGVFSAAEWQHGLHGGEVETSLMLHLAPDRVRRNALENFAGLGAELARENELLGAEKPIGFGWKAQDLNPAGVCGNAAAADAKRGARYLEHLAERFAALLAEVAATPLGVISNARR
jgi:creatinine amidohydrolase